MEALAAGRGIALPAGAAGAAKLLTNATAGYAALRVEFKQPLVAFEGVQEKLADMFFSCHKIPANGRVRPHSKFASPQRSKRVPVDAEPKPIPHIMTAGGFTPSPPVEVEVNGRMFQFGHRFFGGVWF